MPLRPPCAKYRSTADTLDFMLLDSTHADADITLYGVSRAGESVMLTVKEFRPYFFIRVPPGCDPVRRSQHYPTLCARYLSYR